METVAAGTAYSGRVELILDAMRAFVAHTREPDELVWTIVRRVAEVLDAFCAIALTGEDGTAVVPAASHHRDTETLRLLRDVFAAGPVPLLSPAMAPVMQGQGLLLPQASSEDLRGWLRPEDYERALGLEIRSALMVPLRVRDQLFGTLSVIRHGRGTQPLGAADMTIARQLAEHAAIAVASARSFAERDREIAARDRMAQRLRILSEATAEFLAATRDYRGLLDAVARRLATVLGDSCVIRLVAADGVWMEAEPAMHHRDPERLEILRALLTLPARADEGLGGRIVTTRESVLVPSIDPSAFAAGWPPEHRARIVRLGTRSLIGVPLVADEKAIGYAMVSRGAGDPFDADDLGLLRDLAAQAALAITNSRYLHEARNELAERRRVEAELSKTEDQLRQAQKMDAIGRLAGGVAHDFNNLLSIVLSYADLLRDDPSTTEAQRQDLAEIRAAAERAADLTRQLLAFSRQQVVEPRVLDLNVVVGEMKKMLQRLVGEHIDLTTVFAAGLGRVKADPGHVEQVLVNLVINARDAMPAGGRLQIETANVHLDETYAREHLGVVPGPHVMLAVSDNGSGMDRATCERIFEPFFTTKPKGKGTGLGLSTVFGIVKQAGGSIWVYSEIGRGTVFKVYFPRTDAPHQPREAPRPVATLSGSERILLVEDEDALRAVAAQILRKAGYAVIDAANGELALAAAREAERIDLLLTDVIMPEMNGRELAARLCAERPDVRVLYMSGYTENAIVHHRVLDTGVFLLQKPFMPESLLTKVREVLDTPRAS